MIRNPNSANLGNIASNCKHIAMFLADANWQSKLPRINKFIKDTKNIYSKLTINNPNIRNPFEKLLASKLDTKSAEDFLYFYNRFSNLTIGHQSL
ncbi:MAG: hypothetical protein AAB838_00540 [Patescibacteria group bacterium]